MKYKVEDCVSDYCIKNEKGEIVLIVNSRANALTICEILNLDENHENEMLAPIVWESQKIKETTVKFLNMLYWKAVKHIKGKNKNECFIEISFEKLDEIAKQFGVEIKG
jgi:hypothetical protein